MTFAEIPVEDRRIIAQFAAESGHEVSALLGNGRLRKLAHARQDCWLALRRQAQLSYECIAEYFDRHHSTIIYGVREAESRERKREAGKCR